jgi:hypothetical protein
VIAQRGHKPLPLAATADERDTCYMAYSHRDTLTRILAAPALALGLGLAPAYARQPPPAPPSGIVIHLFGPNSVTSHFLSPEPAAAPAGTTAAGAPAGSASASTTDVAGSAPAASTESGPTWGEVAHQMFVTGNPAQEGPAALPKGKAGK